MDIEEIRKKAWSEVTESGKKAIAVDEKYMRLAEEALYSELAIALGVEKDKVLDIIISNH